MAETLVKGVRMQRRAATLAIAAILVGGAMSKGLWAQQEAHQTKLSGVIRTYYIAADEVDWNYAPADHDHMTGKPYARRPGTTREGAGMGSDRSIARLCIASTPTRRSRR